MIPHHQQAIEMADLALDPAHRAGAAVRDLAERIQAAQEPEIELLTAWLHDWEQPMTPATSDMATMADMRDDGTTDMPGMMTVEEEQHLRSLTGVEFDTMWQRDDDQPSPRCQMVRTEQQNGLNADAVALAGTSIEAQQAEIDEVEGIVSGS